MNNNVRKYRERKYLTQGELADKVGVTIQTIGNIENGRNKPLVKTMRKLADELGVSVDELFPQVLDDEDKPARRSRNKKAA